MLCVFLHLQPTTLTAILEHINLCFAALFGVEMLLKVVGDGLYGYIRDGFNVFDGLIVLLRLIAWRIVHCFYQSTMFTRVQQLQQLTMFRFRLASVCK